MSDSSANSYWKANIRLVLSLLFVWFFISFGCGILFVDALDTIRFGGFKLGFWIAQQGFDLRLRGADHYLHSGDGQARRQIQP